MEQSGYESDIFSTNESDASQQESVAKDSVKDTLDEIKQSLVEIKQALADAVKEIRELSDASKTEPRETSAPYEKLKELVDAIQGLPAERTLSNVSGFAASGLTQPEFDLRDFFPIDTYNDATEIILKHPAAQKFVKCEMVRRLYEKVPPGRPDAEHVVSCFCDYVMSRRFMVIFTYHYALWCVVIIQITFFSQSHMGVPGPAGGPKLDWGRISLPMTIYDFYKATCIDLGQPFIKTARSDKETFRDKFGGVRRQTIFNNPIFAKAASRQEKTAMLYTERVDWWEMHRVNIRFIKHTQGKYEVRAFAGFLGRQGGRQT